jgi:hypothetical protein
LADALSTPPEPIPDGIVPEEIVARTENRWLMVMAAMLAVMMAIIVVTGIAGALHPSSNVEIVDPQSLHLQGEFVESNLGTALEPDGTATVRIIAGQYDFIPSCIQVPAQTPVKFRLTSRRAWLSAPRYQRQHHGGARLCLGGTHELSCGGRVPDAVQRVLRSWTSRHVGTCDRSAQRAVRQPHCG